MPRNMLPSLVLGLLLPVAMMIDGRRLFPLRLLLP